MTTRRKYWLHISSTNQATSQVNTAASPQTARNFGLGARLGVYHDGALVIQHLPLSGRVLPERRPAGDAFCLPEGVRLPVHIRTDPAAVEVAGLPLILICLPVPLLQDVEDVRAAIHTPRGTHLPKILGGHR